MLTETKIPRINGLDLAVSLRQMFSALENPVPLPVLAVTASAMNRSTDPDEADFDDYLVKPVSRADLLRAMSRFVPHSMKEEEAVSEESSGSVPDALRRILNPELQAEIAAVRKSLRVSQARALGEKILAASRPLELTELISLGEQLCQAAETFQISKLKTLLGQLEPGGVP